MDAAATLVRFLERRDRAGAIALARRLLDGGCAPQDLVTDVLAPAQQEVGRRWEVNDWSVAQEHAATAITDSVLAAVLESQVSAAQPGPEIVVTCAEGEWHVLPLRMFATLLRLDGWQVSFLGASTPADHLRRFVEELRPFAVAVGCSVPIFLPGVRRMLEQTAAAGVPAIVGGAGCGPDDRRARALGAEGWAPDAAAASRMLERWRREGPPPRPSPLDATVPLQLAAVREDLVEQAVDLLGDRFPSVSRFDERQLRRTAEDFSYILQFLEASLLTGDARVFENFVPWLRVVLTARGLPSEVVRTSLEVVADCLPDQFGKARRLVVTTARRFELGDGGQPAPGDAAGPGG